MTVRGSKIGFNYHDGDDPPVVISAEQFRELETIYGFALPERSRLELLEILRRHVSMLTSERSWQTWQDCERRLKDFERAANALYAYAFERGETTPAISQLETIIEQRSLPLNLGLHFPDLVVIEDPKPGSEWQSYEAVYQVPENTAFGLRLSDHLICGIADNLKATAERVRAEIAMRSIEDAAHKPVKASDAVLLDIKKWAKSNDFNISEYDPTSQEPSPYKKPPSQFSKFVSAVLQMLPPSHVEQNLTDGRVASRLADLPRKKTRKKESAPT